MRILAVMAAAMLTAGCVGQEGSCRTVTEAYTEAVYRCKDLPVVEDCAWVAVNGTRYRLEASEQAENVSVLVKPVEGFERGPAWKPDWQYFRFTCADGAANAYTVKLTPPESFSFPCNVAGEHGFSVHVCTLKKEDACAIVTEVKNRTVEVCA